MSSTSADGARVRADGVARRLDDDEPFVAPVLGKVAVVAFLKYVIPQRKPGNQTNVPPMKFDRWYLKPFVLETSRGDVVIDTSHVRLYVPTRTEGGIAESAIAEGQRIAVVGSVLHDGIAIATEEQSFRAEKPICKLVGNRDHPIIITSAK